MGRAVGAAWTFLAALLVSLGVMLVLFSPDLILDTDARSADGYVEFFFGFVGLAALIVATVAAVMRALARTRWTFDGREGRVEVWMRTTMGHEYDERMSADGISAVKVRRRSSLWSAHQLLLVLGEGDEIVLAQSRSSTAELDAARERIALALGLTSI